MKQIQLTNGITSPNRNIYQWVAPGKPQQTKGILTNPKLAVQPEDPWWPAESKNNACHCAVSSLLKNNPTQAYDVFNLPHDAGYLWLARRASSWNLETPGILFHLPLTSFGFHQRIHLRLGWVSQMGEQLNAPESSHWLFLLLENAPISPPVLKDAEIATVRLALYSYLSIIPIALSPRMKINAIYSVL